MKTFVTYFVLAVGLLLPACSFKRSEDARLRINISDSQGRPVRSVRNGGRNSADLFDTAGHSRASIDLSAAPHAACFFVGIRGTNIKSSMQGKTMSGIKDSCSTFSEMGQVSDLVSFSQLQDEGVSLTLSVGTRAFTLYAINLEGYDATTGCPATTLDQVTKYDKFAKVFAFAKGKATLDRQTTSVTLTQVEESVLESLIPISCYDASLKAPRDIAATSGSISQIEIAWADDNSMESGFYVDRSLDGFSDWTRIATLDADTTTYTDEDLSSNTTYYYRVTAYNITGEAEGSLISATTEKNLPADPPAFALTPMSKAHISLSWDESSEDVEVWRRTAETDSELVTTILKNSGAGYENNSGLVSDTRYFYKTRTKNSDGYSEFTDEQAAYTFPEAPDNVTVTVVDHVKLTVGWIKQSTNHTGFRLEKRTGASGWTSAGTAISSASSKIISGLSSNTLYYFRVIAENDGGSSEASAAGSATTRLSTPTIMKADVISATSISVEWVGDDSAQEHTVSYREDGSNDWTDLPNIVPKIKLVSGLLPHTLYHFKVQSFDGANSSAESGEYEKTTGLATPAAPTVATIADTSIGLEWDSISGATSYTVEYKLTSSAGGWDISDAADGPSMTISGLDPNTEYSFRVIAHNPTQDSAAGAPVQETTRLTAPAISSISADSDTELTANWNSITGAENYRVSYRVAGTSSYTIEPLTSDTSHQVDGLLPNTEYEFIVESRTASGVYSAPSATATKKTKLAKPTISAVTDITHNSITVAWGQVSGATSYTVQWQKGELDPVEYPHDDLDDLTVAASPLEANTEYKIRVIANGNQNISLPSSDVTRTTKVATPVITSVAGSGADSLTVNWESISGATFRLDWQVDGAGASNWTDLPGLTGTSKAVTGLTGGTKYNFRLYAYVNAAALSAYAESSAVMGLEPVDLHPAFNFNRPDTVKVDFMYINGADDYKIEYRRYNTNDPWTVVSFVTSPDYLTGLDENTSYDVRGYSRVGTDNLSAVGETKQTPLTLLKTPIDLSATLSSTDEKSIKLKWTTTTAHEANIQIFRAEDDGVPSAIASFATNVTYTDEYIDTNVNFGVAYTYYVKSREFVNESMLSAPSISVTPKLFAPTGLIADDTTDDNSITLSWNNNSQEANNFRVQRSTDGVNFSSLSPGTTAGEPLAEYNDSSIVVGTRYFYRVRAEKDSAVSDWSAISAETGTTALGSFRVQGKGPANVSFSWIFTPNAYNYILEKKLDSQDDTAWQYAGSVTSAGELVFNYTNLNPGTAYDFRIQAIGDAGPITDWVEKSATTNDGKPTGFTIGEIFPTSMTVHWIEPSGALKCELQWSLGGNEPESWVDVTTVQSDDEHDLAGRLPNTEYKFRIRGSYGAGEDMKSAWVTTTATTADGVPQNFRVIETRPTGIDLAWDELPTEDSYVLEYKPDGGSWANSPAAPVTNAFTFGDLIPGTGYTFRLRAVYNGIDSATVETDTATLDGKPTNFDVSATSDTSVTLTWTDLPLETGYEIMFITAEAEALGGVWNPTPTQPFLNDSTFTLNSLTNATLYSFKIRAKYGGHFSDWVTTTIGTDIGWDPLPWIYESGAPSAREGHTAVWTGSKMIVWGGQGGMYSFLNNGAMYDPATQEWLPMAAPPAGFAGRRGHTAVWTGSKMIIYGGAISTTQVTESGAIFDPDVDNGDGTFGTWTPMNVTTYDGSYPPGARQNHTAIWTGGDEGRMIVYGGINSQGAILVDAMVYNLAGGGGGTQGVWGPMDMGHLLDTATYKSFKHSAVWTGHDMLLFGGNQGGGMISNKFIRYDFETDLQDVIAATANIPSERASHAAAWTGSEMIVWGGEVPAAPDSEGLSDGARYNPGNDTWTPMDQAPIAGRFEASSIWASGANKFVVWGGQGDDGLRFKDGAYYFPQHDTWVSMPTTNAPTERKGATIVWTGTGIIVWGGIDQGEALVNSGAYLKVTSGFVADQQMFEGQAGSQD